MSKKRKVITIDGLAATGKSSIARELSLRTGFAHFSSGLIYRLLGYAAISHNIDVTDESAVLRSLESEKFEIRLTPAGENTAFLNGEDVTSALATPEVSNTSSLVSAFPSVRALLVRFQREIFPDRDLIAEGRDMGSVIFPEADLKFFIKVDPKIRVERRLKQLQMGRNFASAELNSLIKKMELEIFERDRRDQERPVSPTVPPDGAIIIDNGGGSLTEVVERMYDFVSKKKLL